MVATSQGLFALGTAVAFALSAMLFKAGTLTIGTVYLIFQYTEVLRQPTEQIRNEVQDLQQADASMGRVEALLATAPRLADGPGVALPPGPLAVELDGVSFGYAEDAPVLRDISVLPGAGPRAGRGGAHRQRQDDADAAPAALLRSTGRRGAPGRRGPADGPPRGGARAHRPGHPGGAALQRQRARQPDPLRRQRAG